MKGLERPDTIDLRPNFGAERANLSPGTPNRVSLRYEREDSRFEPVAQGQYVVSNTCCPALRSGFPFAKSLKKIKKNGHLTDFCTGDLKRL